ncbi:longevity assurance proteins LAG1/LAC1 [Marasmius fiardii PR-910]|nr:longevity assurance proteins LAG1/LAC1 [Marasmius fiardii PR-910]
MNSFNASEWLHTSLLPFFTLSYPTDLPKNPDSFHDAKYYGVGPQDLCLIITIIAVYAILRDVLRLGVFEPFSRWKLNRDLQQKYATKGMKHNGNVAKTNGHSSLHGNGHVITNGNGQAARPTKKEQRKFHRSVLRFAEQGWPIVYYPLQTAYGVYINRELPTRLFNPIDLWVDYPHIPLAGPLKFYYLTQTAFYLHQMLILNAEAPRKDHWQMMTHHVITVFLMGASYFYNFTRVGCLLMVLMDWCDIFLPMAKMIRYLALPQIYCDATFVWWLISWVVTRHLLFAIVIWSAMFDGPRLHPWKWDPASGYYFSKGAWGMFISCLLALEVLQIMWFATICRIAWRVLTAGQGASDDRSDEEDSGTEEKEE